MSLRNAIATWFAKRDNGEHYVGFESSHGEKADAILAAIRSYYEGRPERVTEAIREAFGAHINHLDGDELAALAAALSKIE